MKVGMPPHEPSALALFLKEYGELLVTGALGVLGWLIAKFTDLHITTMREVVAEIAKINVKVASIDANIVAIGKRQDDLSDRVTRLEDHERDH